MRLWAAARLLAALGLTSCVANQYERVREAQANLDACVERYSATDSRCDALRQAVRVEESRYSEQARGSWGCLPTDPNCPLDP